MSSNSFCQDCDDPDCPMRECHTLSRSPNAHSESTSHNPQSTGSHPPGSDNQSSGPSSPQRQVLPPAPLQTDQNVHAEEHSSMHVASANTFTLFNDQHPGWIPFPPQAASMPLMMFINSAMAPANADLIPFGLIPPAGQPSVHYDYSTIVPIPLIRYEPPPRGPIFQERFIYFSPNGVGYVNLGSCLSGNIPPGLPTDPLFPGLSNGSHKLALRFTWPIPQAGPRYRPFFKQFDISRGTSAGQLACKIARLINEFIEANQDHNYGTNDTDAQWRVGPLHITIDQILLVAAKQITKGSVEPILKLQRSFPHAAIL